MSACRVCAARSRVPVWHSVTVAFSVRRVSSSPSGRPTVTPRPITHHLGALDLDAVPAQQLDDAGRRARQRRRLAQHQPAEVGRVQPVGVLVGVDLAEHERSRRAPSAAAAARCTPVHAGSSLRRRTAARISSCVAVAGRSSRIEAMPTSAQSLCLPLTYQRRARVVADQDRAQTRGDAALLERGDALGQLGLDRAGGRGAVQGLCGHAGSCQASVWASVGEVAGAGEVHRHAGRLARPRSSARRGSTRRAGRSRARRRRAGPAAVRRTGRTRRRPRPTRPPARRRASTASWQESTRLTWPMPTPTEAPSVASRIALDFTARQRPPGEGEVGEGRRRRPASPAASVQVGGVVARRRRRGRRVCISTPPLIRRDSTGSRRARRRGSSRIRRFFLRLQQLSAPSSYAGRDDHLGEDLGDLLGHLDA